MKTQLTNDSTPREILSELTSYLPFLSNASEILNDLCGLGLNKTSIARILSGGTACVFGEIVSPRSPCRKAVISSALVSLIEIEGTYRVCIDGLPVDVFLTNEIQRQKMLENTSKEKLAQEIRMLRSTVESASARVKALEDHIKTLEEYVRLS